MSKIKSFYSNFFQSALGEIEMMQCAEVEDLLSGFSNKEIEVGFKSYQMNGPKTDRGSLRKPAGGDLYQFLMDIRGKSARRAEKPKNEVLKTALSDEERAEKNKRADDIIKDVGFKLKVVK